MQRNSKVFRLSDYKVSDYLIEHIDLTIDLTKTPVQSNSRLNIKPNPDSSDIGTTLELDGENMKLVRLKLNGKILDENDYVLTEHSLTIKNVPANTNFVLESETLLGDNPDLFGLYETENTWLAKAETEGMRRILYCKDRPDVLATYTTTIIANETDFPVLLANGRMIKTEKVTNSTHAVTWHDDIPKPTYLFAMVAGNLDKSVTHFITRSGRDMPIEFYVRPDATEKCRFAKDILKKALRWDEDTYQMECSLPQHMVAGVDKYASGASEPTGLNLFNTEYLYANAKIKTDTDILHVAEVVSHELFHYWSGDRVTLRDWFNLTYKEGLTTFRSADFREQLFGHDLIRLLDGKNLDERAPRPDTYTAVRSLYTAAAYEKSGDIFRMIMLTIGRDVFYRGMNKFFIANTGKAVTIEDLINSLSQFAGIDLSSFLVWFTEPGIPQLDISDDYNSVTKHYTLKVKQSGADDQYKCRPVPITIGLLAENGEALIEEKTLLADKSEMIFEFDNIVECPVPSLLRSFSAPVKLKYEYHKSDLLLLMKHDSNLYNRYEASRNMIRMLVEEYCANGMVKLKKDFYNTYRTLLKDRSMNHWLLAEIINLPSEEELIDMMQKPNLDKIREARTVIAHSMANELSHAFKSRLDELDKQGNSTTPQFDDFDIKDAATRRLKQVCISYLADSEPEIVKQRMISQFNDSLRVNMNETINALTILCNTNSSDSKIALQQFYECWNQDTNAINYWFRIQAAAHTDEVIKNISELMNHPAFDISNPNKVSALLNPFIKNPYGFHNVSGEGYKLLGRVIIKLDSMNPSVAARLAEKFNTWDKYDLTRQRMMYEQLLMLDSEAQSVSVKDMVKKGLEKGKPENKTSSVPCMLKWMRKRDETIIAKTQEDDNCKQRISIKK